MKLFISVNFNEKLTIRLGKIMAELQKNTLRGNFSRTSNLHLTLQYIGETENLVLAKAALDSVSFNALPLRFDRVSRFKRSGGDICWLGVSEDKELKALAQSVGAALRARGFRLEDRSFQAHMTLAREVVFKPGFEPESFALPDNLSFTAEKISLMKSERIKGVLTYTELYAKAANRSERS